MSKIDPKDPPPKHATRMFNWEKQVASDPNGRRQATAHRVVPILRDKVDKGTGKARVEQSWLAKQLDVSVYGVQKALAWLERQGHLRIHSRKHLREANDYEPLLQSKPDNTKPTPVGFEKKTQYQPGLVVETNAQENRDTNRSWYKKSVLFIKGPTKRYIQNRFGRNCSSER